MVRYGSCRTGLEHDLALNWWVRLASTVKCINDWLRTAISQFLIQDENGRLLPKGALRSRFNKARTLAKVDFQFRDIRGKAATDTGDLAYF